MKILDFKMCLCILTFFSFIANDWIHGFKIKNKAQNICSYNRTGQVGTVKCVCM
jgi:hypothetical protein